MGVGENYPPTTTTVSGTVAGQPSYSGPPKKVLSQEVPPSASSTPVPVPLSSVALKATKWVLGMGSPDPLDPLMPTQCWSLRDWQGDKRLSEEPQKRLLNVATTE